MKKSLTPFLLFVGVVVMIAVAFFLPPLYSNKPKPCYYRENNLQRMLCEANEKCIPHIITQKGDTFKIESHFIPKYDLKIYTFRGDTNNTKDIETGYPYSDVRYYIKTKDSCYLALQTKAIFDFVPINFLLKDITGDSLPEIIHVYMNACGIKNMNYNAWRIAFDKGKNPQIIPIKSIDGLSNIYFDYDKKQLVTYSRIYQNRTSQIDTLTYYRWNKDFALVPVEQFTFDLTNLESWEQKIYIVIKKHYRYDETTGQWIFSDSARIDGADPADYMFFAPDYTGKRIGY